MLKPAKRIPDWYLEDWTPSSRLCALPEMNWTDCERAIDRLGPTPAMKLAAHQRLRALREASDGLAPMETLQAIILIAAALGDPRQATGRARTTPTPASMAGALPRWGFADVEAAISYAFTEVPRAIALLRYAQLLACYGERRSGEEIMRTIFLTVLGLPVRQARTVEDAAPPPTAKAA